MVTIVKNAKNDQEFSSAFKMLSHAKALIPTDIISLTGAFSLPFYSSQLFLNGYYKSSVFIATFGVKAIYDNWPTFSNPIDVNHSPVSTKTQIIIALIPNAVFIITDVLSGSAAFNIWAKLFALKQFGTEGLNILTLFVSPTEINDSIFDFLMNNFLTSFFTSNPLRNYLTITQDVIDEQLKSKITLAEVQAKIEQENKRYDIFYQHYKSKLYPQNIKALENQEETLHKKNIAELKELQTPETPVLMEKEMARHQKLVDHFKTLAKHKVLQTEFEKQATIHYQELNRLEALQVQLSSPHPKTNSIHHEQTSTSELAQSEHKDVLINEDTSPSCHETP